MNYVLTFLLFTLIQSSVVAQLSTLHYEKVFCECHGEFDSLIYSRNQLNNTLDFLWNSEYYEVDATAWYLSDLRTLNVEKVTKESAQFISFYENLEIVNDAFWKKIRGEKLIYYKKAALLREVTVKAYKDPQILLKYNAKNDLTMYYRKALIIGGDLLVEAWKKVNEANKKDNGEPEKLQLEFEKKYNSENKMLYARLAVMNFGWWNSANDELPHYATEYDFNHEFEKLLLNVDCHCDEDGHEHLH